MADYNPNQIGSYPNADQDWSENLTRRAKDIYGDQDYYGERYEPYKRYEPYRRPSPVPYPQPGSRYGNLSRSDYRRSRRGNYYGRGNYHGNLEEDYRRQQDYADWNRIQRNRDFEEGQGGWWSKEEPRRIGYEPEGQAYEQEIRNYNRGKGPRFYSRSDERIFEDVNDRLTDDPYIDASDLEVNVTNGNVTLTGTVEDRHTKRIAADIAEDVLGVKNVENRLRVELNAGKMGDRSKTRESVI